MYVLCMYVCVCMLMCGDTLRRQYVSYIRNCSFPLFFLCPSVTLPVDPLVSEVVWTRDFLVKSLFRNTKLRGGVKK